jgi:DNA polymerase IIIc chi subunit
MKELMNLCAKIVKKSPAVIHTMDEAGCIALSNFFWNNQPFLPHGVSNEEFAEIQPLLITADKVKRPVIINFEEVLFKHTEVECETYILWNVATYCPGFTSYIQKGLTWIKT